MSRWTILCLGLGILAIARAEGPATRPVLTNSVGMRLTLIPAGEFPMGAADGEKEARDDERPRHRIRITRPFHLGVHEVTQQEYERVMGSNPSFFSPSGPGKDRVAGRRAGRLPVEQVSWHEAVEFCRRLSALPAEQKAGRAYRLPTEAEWEYACRAGTTSATHYGNALSARQANFNGRDPYGEAGPGAFLLRPAEVGSYPPNAWGLFDMHGNVWEWCADWYGADYYRHAPAADPTGPASGSARVIRGGGWRTEGGSCRSAYRNADVPAGRYYVTGFRVVMTTGPSAPDTPPLARPTSLPGSQPRGGPPPDPAALLRGEDWPRWRGPRGDGTWHGPPLPERWPEGGPRCLWRQPLGGGHAGPVVAGGRVFAADYQKAPDEVERVLCLDAVTGQLLWSHRYPVRYGKLEYGNGPRATPAVFDGRVYTLGALGQLYCLDAATGKVRWSADLVRDYRARMPGWGFAASPVVVGDLLVVHAGAEPDGGVLALDRRTGKEVWRSLPDEAGYATPLLITARSGPQLVCWTPASVCGLEPRTGKVLWAVPFRVTYGTAIATPVFAEDTVLVSGYWEGARAIRLGDRPGDATPAWSERRRLRALMSQPLYRDGHAFLLDKRDGLVCCELRTGRKLWDDGNRMTPKGRNPQATLVWTGDGDRALVLNSDGELILARLNPRGYQEQARTKIIGPTWAHPAYAGTCVFARDDREIVCFALPETGRPQAPPPRR